MPMASTMPNRVSVLSVNPRTVNTARVPTRDTGTASIGITVARQVCKKMKTTIITRMSDSPSVLTTSSSDAVTNTVWSTTTW